MRIEEEPPLDDEIQPIEPFVESKSATDLKALQLYTIAQGGPTISYK